ncbi:hypothetical protein V8F06_004975 [Rhypophila decipiens]
MAIWILPQTSIFGKQQTSLDYHIPQSTLELGLKAMYASDILLLLSLGLTKLSVCACYLGLIPGNDMFHRRWSLITALMIALWTVAFTLAAAFRCGVRPWWRSVYDEGIECLDENAFLTSISITNILTDVGLVAIPVSLVVPMSLPLRTRLTTILVFSARALIVIPCTFQLLYISPLGGGKPDQQWTAQLLLGDGLRIGKYVIATQAVQFVGIAAACIIYLSPLLQSLGSGRHAMATAVMMMGGGNGLTSSTPKRSTQDLLVSVER